MRVLVHADDLGLSKGITDSILHCVDEGAVNSTSILVNGEAFDYALRESSRRDDLRVALHFNLVEGRPVAPAEEVDLLLDGGGFFRHSFFSLWLLHLRSTAEARLRLERQVRAELDAQVETLQRARHGTTRLHLDGHRHLHLVPFVFAEILRAAEDLGISRIRLINEPWPIDAQSLKNCTLPQVAKHTLLRVLSKRFRGALDAHGITYPDLFLGILLNGACPTSATADLLKRRTSAQNGSETDMEILFHPGRAAAGEEDLWHRYPGFRHFYFSKRRDLEVRTLKSAEFRMWLERLTALEVR